MYKIFDKIISLITNATGNRRVVSIDGGQKLAEVKIERGTFQGKLLSPLLLVIAMIPLSYMLSKFTGGYKFYKSQEMINHLMDMNDSKNKQKNKQTKNKTKNKKQPNKKRKNFDTNNKNIQPGYRNGIWH